MDHIGSIIITVVSLAVFVWMLSGYKKNQPIDPTDPRTIGTLIGLTGGSIKDAAVARFALEQFEKTHGRKATARDMGMVAGMMKSIH